MQKHTAGPWTIGGDLIYAKDPIQEVAISLSKCRHRPDAPPYEESQANARLISAAPDLLEMLKKAQARLFMSQGNDEMYFEIGKVIDKAEGNE
jgi:hypothetical protein